MPPGAATAAPSSLLALATTVHVALLMLRRYRGVNTLGRAGVLLPSAAFAAMPWIFPDPTWIAVGVAVHLAWFVACEKLLPPVAAPSPARRPTAAAPPPPAPAPTGFIPVPVLAVFEESGDIRTFRMARPEGFAFAPGQFLTVKVQADGKPLVRCYSISSSPAATGYLEISVKRQGVVSGMLHSTIRPGSTLSIKRPNGKFTYPGGDDRPVVLLAGGVGITPLMSMLRHAVASEPTRPVTMVVSAKGEKDVTFRRELEWLAERHPQVKVAFALSGGGLALVGGPSSSKVDRFSGRVNAAVIRRLVPDIVNSIFMICGPDAMMDGMRQLLAALGVPDGQIRFEAFAAAVAMSKEEGAPAQRAAAAARPRAAAARGGGSTLTLRQTGATVTIEAGQTLLDAAEGAGAAIESSCRAGVCMTCRTRLLAGEVDCDSDSLDDDDRAAGFILPCVAVAKGNCELDA